MAKVYEVNMGGAVEEVETLKEVAAILGVTRVSGKDIENGKYPEVVAVIGGGEEGIESIEELDEALADAGIEDNKDEEVLDTDDAKKFLDDHVEVVVVGDAPTKTLTEEEPTIEDTIEQATKDTFEAGVYEDDIEFPEVGEFKDEKAIKKYIKKLSNEELAEWCELEGATWKHNDHESINRMRMAMAIKAVHFPELAKKAGTTKKKSKYADYSTEDLVQMALDNDVAVPDAKGDERIERMYTIMALRKAGLIS